MSDPEMSCENGKNSEDCVDIILIRNIPPFCHSSSLRLFFSNFIETNRFICFHFRHRPEKIATENSHLSKADNGKDSTPKKTLCCFVKVYRQHLKDLMCDYNGKNWLDEKGEITATRCHIIKVKFQGNQSNSEETERRPVYATRAEKRIEAQYHLAHEKLTSADIGELIEFKPPPLMPQGNVGTPTNHFLDLINSCQMPSSLIQKLGLQFKKGRTNRKYGIVGFSYDGVEEMEEAPEDVEFRPPVQSSSKRKFEWFSKKDKAAGNDDDDDLDIDDCEEWERHEALHDDVTSHERNKPTMFEDEAEVVWEKGGPGIVWHTDANFWKEHEGLDELEAATDDWDVDMSAYYGEEGERMCDKDAKDFLEIRREERLKKGLQTEPLFEKKKKGKGEKAPDTCQPFTEGFGKKVLEKHGWKEGKGVGKWKEGLKEPIIADGQLAYSKKGLGYYGEELHRKPGVADRAQFTPINKAAMLMPGNSGIRITTKYDAQDEGGSLKRRKDPHSLSYR